MPYDPLSLADPSNPFHGLEQVQAARRARAGRQQALVEMLGAPAPTIGGENPVQLPAPVPQAGGMQIAQTGLAGLAQALKGQPGQDTYSSKIGGVGQAENTGGWMQNLFTANGGAKS
jgi:hypothetical protein